MKRDEVTRRCLLKGAAMAGVGAFLKIDSSHQNPKYQAPAITGLANEYGSYDALGLAALIASKQISPLELLNAVHRRVDALNPKLNAFCHLFFEKAEAQIANNLSYGPFRGVPFALKDVGQYLTGTITSAGSRLFKNNITDFDSTLASRHKRAGLVIFGKTNCPELGLTNTTESILFGQTHNPWKSELTPGGSSGGAAAAVASRIIPMAHGSDGGGSIRTPASCCGVFGFKPTRNRVPLGPSQFEGWAGCTQHHALTISVRDSAALLDASVGTELGSPFFSPAPSTPFLAEVGKDPGSLRVALVLATPGGTPLAPECKNTALEAAKLCENLGHKVEELSLLIDQASAGNAHATVVEVSVARVLDDAAANLGRTLTDRDVEPMTLAVGKIGMQVTALTYARAIATLHQTGLAMAKFQKKYDVILSPTLAKPPVPLGLLSLSQHDVMAWLKEVVEFSPYTALYNVTGQPSMSVPLHWTPEGLPVGVMFSGRFGEDARLFRLASQLERAQGWQTRKPPPL